MRNRILFIFLILSHDRRRVLYFNITANPTSAWAAQQVVEAFLWDDPPKCLLCDRDKIYGETFRKRATGIGFEEVPIAAQSPRQNPYVVRSVSVAMKSSGGTETLPIQLLPFLYVSLQGCLVSLRRGGIVADQVLDKRSHALRILAHADVEIEQFACGPNRKPGM